MKVNYSKTLAGFTLCLYLQLIAAKSLAGLKDQAFMILGSRASENALRRQTRSLSSSITSVRVTSVVKSRFAKVTTVSEMENTHDEAKELTFSIRLPDAAFITEFTMLVDGVTFIGKVKEKALAEEEYKKAKASGNSAGLVTADIRETQTFSVAANVPAQSKVTFTLVYQELLKRRLSKYNHEIFVNPGQIVDDFVIDVYITEQTGITMLEARPPQGGMGPRGKVASGYDSTGIVPIDIDIRRSKYQAKVTFKPSSTQQRRLLMIPENDRKMTVIYDVTREFLGGEIQTRNGYFVHYFAPQNLPVLPKRVVFVIDRSGSMRGTKIAQTKSAFETVLKEMSDADEFNIVTFAGDITVWETESDLVKVTEENVKKAIKYVRSINANGGTNLNGGLLKGVELLESVGADERVSSAVITLSDGDPTAGVTDEAQIRKNVKKAVDGRFSVFCIGFGRNLNHDFLKRLANENDGLARKIYEDSDADLQLEGFFQEVATPLLLRVVMSYSGSNISDVSKVHCDQYFDGSEVLIVGAKLDDKPLHSKIIGHSLEGEVEYNIVSSEVDDSFQHWYDDTGDFEDFIERIWAYYSIREKLEDKVLAETDEEVKKLVDEAMALSLKYNFVTPLTSMVVVLPEDEITTTTPVTPTVYPPIPPCWFRGATIPDYITGPPIWCPYIIDGKAETNRPTATRRLSSVRPAYGRISGAAPAAPAPAGARPAAPQSRTAPPQKSKTTSAQKPVKNNAPAFGGFGFSPYIMSDVDMYGYAPSVLVQKADNCSGTLTNDSASISLPEQNHSLTTVLCEWDIKLPKGSWIDLYVERLESSHNEVSIVSKGETLVAHYGGVTASKYFYIAHNEFYVVMRVDPAETLQTGLVLKYQRFVPDDKPIVTEKKTQYTESGPTNCGQTISSTDASSGYITSPNYPSSYSSNSHCKWKIENLDASNKELKITFLDMDIETNGNKECLHDRAVITTKDSSQNFCGMQTNEAFSSSDDVVTVEFISDANLQSGGFRAHYEFVPKVTNH